MTMKPADTVAHGADSGRAVLIALRRIIRATDLAAKQLARDAGLTTSQYMVLQLLDTEGEMTAGAIASHMSLAKPTVTIILDGLEARGWIRRRRGQEDQRRIVVSLTARGRRSLQAAPLPLQERFLREFERLADWEKAFLVAALQRVSDMLGASGIDASPVLDVGTIARPLKPGA